MEHHLFQYLLQIWSVAYKKAILNQCLLQSWSLAYEKAIVNRYTENPKKVVDEACYYAVEDWTTHLYELELISEIKGKELHSIQECIQHHIDNLIAGKMWVQGEEPQYTQTDDGENVLMIEIPVCNYQDGCKRKSGLDEQDFNQPENLRQFRCQRLGCFIGAVRKYLVPNTLSNQEDITYFMTKVHRDEGCKGLIFVSQGFLRRILEGRYLYTN
ncbi:MAG: hypothetical protein WBV73_21115 [Phormidium sp.]